MKKSPHKHILFIIVLLVTIGFISSAFSFWAWHQEGIAFNFKKLIGIIKKDSIPLEADYWAVEGWNRTMRKCDYHPDIIFFGNSITYYGHWEDEFGSDSCQVITLGYPGDNLKGMMKRVDCLKNLQPKKLFLMAGINGLKSMTLSEFTRAYANLVDSIGKATPSTIIYLESILPVCNSNRYADNNKIIEANRIIKDYATNKEYIYLDMHNLYYTNGGLVKSLSEDGIHLKREAYKPWYQYLKRFINK